MGRTTIDIQAEPTGLRTAEVERLGLAVDELACEPESVDAVVAATRAAQATHQAEKLRALRNGVLHSVGTDALKLSEQARCFRLVEQFNPSPLELLTLLTPPGSYDSRGITVSRRASRATARS